MSFKEVYNSQKLIAEVQKRPGLYDPSCKTYGNKLGKMKLWQEVCEAVVENWKNLDKGERTVKGRDVQKRWKSLRDCFKRELLIQEKMKNNGMDAYKTIKRKYIYFDMLSFLLPQYSKTPYGGKTGRKTNLLNTFDHTNETEAETVDTNDDNENSNTFNTNFSLEDEVDERKTSINLQQNEATNIQSINTIINNETTIDGDVAFLVSLLPTIRKFNDEQKFQVRMLFMDIVRQVQLGLNPQLQTNTINLRFCKKISCESQSKSTPIVNIKNEAMEEIQDDEA